VPISGASVAGIAEAAPSFGLGTLALYVGGSHNNRRVGALHADPKVTALAQTITYPALFDKRSWRLYFG